MGCVATGSVFENSWLELREGADHRARSMALTEAVDSCFIGMLPGKLVVRPASQ
ncbi:hypothetical protein AU14_00885 [Marinobacter similis]|uniref:Uncharacterized protein n=1 Tax=Marinobacter similis TaxID=1420916 RepID=W5YTY4_9GAMM|nr:hypothetical protein AU14_00885 [Marinobacter similis]